MVRQRTVPKPDDRLGSHKQRTLFVRPKSGRLRGEILPHLSCSTRSFVDANAMSKDTSKWATYSIRAARKKDKMQATQNKVWHVCDSNVFTRH